MLNTKKEKNNVKKYSVSEKGHGRIEKRETYIINDLEMLSDIKKWKNIKTIIMAKNTREINNTISVQDKYYISDLELSAKEFGEITRKHWEIENNLHWVLDMYFKEDLCTSKKDNSIYNFATLKRYVTIL